MSQDTSTIHDFQFELICDYFTRLERQGPGSVEVTLKALGFIEGLPADARIADLGCGTGGQTLTLAEHTTGHITAIDVFPRFIDSLNERVRERNLQGRVTGQVGSMAEPPFQHGELDLIWAEGSIYNVGFEHGINLWKPFLKPGGYLAVTEGTWFTEERPREIEDFWNNAYPEISVVSTKVRQMEQAGYRIVAVFALPSSCWTDFYEPARQIMEPYLEAHNHHEAAVKFVQYQRMELDLYRRYGEHYGYVFYIGQKLPG